MQSEPPLRQDAPFDQQVMATSLLQAQLQPDKFL